MASACGSPATQTLDWTGVALTVDGVDNIGIVPSGITKAKVEEETALISKATEAATFFKSSSLSTMVTVALLVAYRWCEWVLWTGLSVH